MHARKERWEKFRSRDLSGGERNINNKTVDAFSKWKVYELNFFFVRERNEDWEAWSASEEGGEGGERELLLDPKMRREGLSESPGDPFPS